MDSQSANFHKIQERIDQLERNKKRRTIYLFLLFLPFVLGIILTSHTLVQGLAYAQPSQEKQRAVLSAEHVMWKTSEPNAGSQEEAFGAIDTIPLTASKLETTEASSVLVSVSGKTYLHARGPRKVGAPLVFSIANYQPEIQYTIDFGNGVSQTVPDGRLNYSYPEEGNYTARVVGIYEGEEILTRKLSLSIYSPLDNGAL